jgi:biofilm PGA synthesis N-glycosyltransferase PgaC
VKSLLYSLTNNLTNVLFLHTDFITGLLILMPFVLLLEIPWTLFIICGMVKYKLGRMREGVRHAYFPAVTCIVTCYNEGRAIEQTVISLTEQLYPGKIQIILVIDGASVNTATLAAAKAMEGWVNGHSDRSLLVLPKWQRGGVVSSSNLALHFATGEIVIKADGDSSFDNNMAERATRHFADETVVAVSGCLRVRNADKTMCAAFQAIEYFTAIHASKTALSEFNMVNNISGAFGIFRRKLLDLVEGWDAGTAEDLDMTLRIKNYFANTRRNFRIVFDPEAICFTDVPDSFTGFFKQRLRWEGDYPFILSKHSHSISPRFMGWPNFLGILLSMFTQVIIPGMVFIYTLDLLYRYRLDIAFSLLFTVYLFYIFLLGFLYFAAVLLLSERRGDDFSRFHLLPFMPLFLFAAKINSLVAILWEWFGAGHNDSSMAPWWVLRKSKF